MAEALACKGPVLHISYPCTGNKKWKKTTAHQALHVWHLFVYKHFLSQFQKQFPESKSYMVGNRGVGGVLEARGARTG